MSKNGFDDLKMSKTLCDEEHIRNIRQPKHWKGNSDLQDLHFKNDYFQVTSNEILWVFSMAMNGSGSIAFNCNCSKMIMLQN